MKMPTNQRKKNKKRGNSSTFRNRAPITPDDALVVDGWFDLDDSRMRYGGVNNLTGSIEFKVGPFAAGSNNVGNFLALVHALAHCKAEFIGLPIYCDNLCALAWVQHKKSKTWLQYTPENKLVIELIERAEKWLNENPYTNELRFWNSKLFGRNPAKVIRK